MTEPLSESKERVTVPPVTAESVKVMLDPWLTIQSLIRIALGLAIVLGSVAILILAWQLASFFSTLLLIFFTAWLIAILMTPIIRQFMSLSIPKPIAIAATFILVVGFIAGFGTLVVPGLIDQTKNLAANLGPVITDLSGNVTSQLARFGIIINLNQLEGQLQSISNTVLQNLLSAVTGIPGFLFNIVLIIIITALFLAGRDYSEPQASPAAVNATKSTAPSGLAAMLPDSWNEWLKFSRTSFELNFGQFFRGQILVALTFGIVTGLLLWVTGFNYSVTTGCICGLLMIVPFFGAPLSFIPLIIVTLSTNQPAYLIIGVLVVFYVVQTLLLNVVLPRLVGRSSGIGPITTLFVLLAGAQVGGIFGTLIAVPLVGTFIALGGRFMHKVSTLQAE